MKRRKFVMGHFGKQAFHKMFEDSRDKLQARRKGQYKSYYYPIYIYKLKAVHSDLFKELWL